MTNRTRTITAVSLAIFLLASIPVIAFFTGFKVAIKNSWPTQQVLYIEKRLNRLFGISNEPPRPHKLETAYFSIKIRWHDIPVGRDGKGGGLTSFYEDVILLTHDGRFFAVGGESPVFLAALEPPSNNYEDFVAASRSEEYAAFNHDTSRLRFNDVLFVNDPKFLGIVVSFTEWNKDSKCYRTAIATLRIPESAKTGQSVRAQADDWNVVFRTKPCLPLAAGTRALEGHMAGGRIASLGNGKIVLGSGDYHWDGLEKPIAYAQDDDADYGKTIEVDLATGDHRHLSKGQRNIQGIVVTNTGAIWTTEHGPRGGDELNRIISGRNYGWPFATYGINYDGTAITEEQNIGRHGGYEPPVFAWTPSIATSNITQVVGFHSAWDGDLLAATLGDKTLYRIRLSDQNAVTTVEPIKGLERRIRYVHMHQSNQIFVWFDDSQIAVLEPDIEVVGARKLEDLILLHVKDAEDTRKLKGLVESCLMCHSLDKTGAQQLPPLTHMYGNAIAASTGYSYSPAILGLNGRWSAERLEAFIFSPENVAPGTYMPNPGISEADAARVAEFLRLISIRTDVANDD